MTNVKHLEVERGLVIIPTYNEIDNVPTLIDAVLTVDDRIDILFVDDGSPDGTGDYIEERMASEPRVNLIRRPRKMGLGTAYIRGFQYAIENGYKVALEMDADFSHDPATIPTFLREIEDADPVIGSRYIRGVNVVNWPMSRLLLSYFANVYSRIVSGMPLRDGTGGFKCFRTDVLRKIDLSKIRSNGYSFQIEMNFLVWNMGGVIREIPIVFVDRRSGVSKMSKAIVREAVWLVWKLRFARMFGTIRKRYLPTGAQSSESPSPSSSRSSS